MQRRPVLNTTPHLNACYDSSRAGVLPFKIGLGRVATCVKASKFKTLESGSQPKIDFREVDISERFRESWLDNCKALMTYARTIARIKVLQLTLAQL